MLRGLLSACIATELYFRHFFFSRNNIKKEIVLILNLEEFIQISKVSPLKEVSDHISALESDSSRPEPCPLLPFCT